MHLLTQLGPRDLGFGGRNLFPFIGNDIIKNAHGSAPATARDSRSGTVAGSWLAAIRASSAFSARPWSRDLAANAAPSFKLSALPAMIKAAPALKRTISRNGPGFPRNSARIEVALCSEPPALQKGMSAFGRT